jgi:molecular chaperone DnaJ
MPVAAEVEIELVEAATGIKVKVPLQRAVVCATCHGDGAAPGSAVVACPRCRGGGFVQSVSRSLFGEFVRRSPCPECSGTGRRVEKLCETCKGGGRTVESQSLEVEIPAGIHDGQRIRISGEGHAGTLGGQSGDAYVRVRVRPDERFVREGNDLFSQVDLTVVQAALGVTMPVETITGTQELEFDAGTQPGEVRLLRGKGMPVLHGFGRGDHRVLVNVTVPRKLTADQRRLLQEFDDLSDEETYDHDKGFFEKLKRVFH